MWKIAVGLPAPSVHMDRLLPKYRVPTVIRIETGPVSNNRVSSNDGFFNWRGLLDNPNTVPKAFVRQFIS